MFCSACGHSVLEDQKYCSVCGNKLAEISSSEKISQSTPDSKSFEDLVAARVMEARKSKLRTDENLAATLQDALPVTKLISESSSNLAAMKVSRFVFIRSTFVVGNLLLVLGYFIFPFAYVLESRSGFVRKFEWRLHTIASLLSDRSNEGYFFGPALAFLVGGHLWTLLFAIIITVIVYVNTQPFEESEPDFLNKVEKRRTTAIVIGRVSVVLMALIFTWQLTGMLTLQRAADVRGGLSGQESLSYFSLGLGSVTSLLGLLAFVFGGASLINRASEEKSTK